MFSGQRLMRHVALLGHAGVDGEGMYLVGHHVVDTVVNQTMPGQRRLAAKGFGRDGNPIVAGAASGAGMASVQMTFVFDLKRNRLEFLQPLANAVDAFVTHGDLIWSEGWSSCCM